MPNKDNYRYYAKSAKEVSFGTRIFIKVAGFLIKILFRPEYHHLEYIPNKQELGEAYFIMPNHSSLLDPAFLHLTIPDYVYWVSKKELFENKLLARLFHALQMIPLDRNHMDISAIKTILTYIKEKKVVGLFPQGRRVDVNHYQETLPQTGVAAICIRYKTTILPVYCASPYKLFQKNHFYFGAPYCLNPNISATNKKEKHQLMVNEIMRRSYHIVGLPYFD